MTRLWALISLLATAAATLAAQPEVGDYFIDNEHPRLLLTSRRTRLLERERERQSMRWVQFEALMEGGAQFPEPAFAHALYRVTGGGDDHCTEAARDALSSDSDLRQQALVFDWCHDVLPDATRTQLAARLARGLDGRPADPDIATVRSRTLAAVALAGHSEGTAERELAWVIDDWWRGRIIPALDRGERVIPRTGIYPLVELMHVIWDNVRIDLREDSKQYFVKLPFYLLLSYYPAVYPAAENEYHVPVIRGGGQPDLHEAALARSADLALVALDPNSREVQFLQGWSIQDRFLMRGVFGITYEFLWANPYQPGFSFRAAPLSYYDPRSGTLALRSSWDGDAAWFHNRDGEKQTFVDGRIVVLDSNTFTAPFDLGANVLIPLGARQRFAVKTGKQPAIYYLMGLEPRTSYDIEVDDEGLFEATTDPEGTLALDFPAGRTAGVRLHKSPVR